MSPFLMRPAGAWVSDKVLSDDIELFPYGNGPLRNRKSSERHHRGHCSRPAPGRGPPFASMRGVDFGAGSGSGGGWVLELEQL